MLTIFKKKHAILDVGRNLAPNASFRYKRKAKIALGTRFVYEGSECAFVIGYSLFGKIEDANKIDSVVMSILKFKHNHYILRLTLSKTIMIETYLN